MDRVSVWYSAFLKTDILHYRRIQGFCYAIHTGQCGIGAEVVYQFLWAKKLRAWTQSQQQQTALQRSFPVHNPIKLKRKENFSLLNTKITEILGIKPCFYSDLLVQSYDSTPCLKSRRNSWANGRTFVDVVEAAIMEHAWYEHLVFGPIYACEINEFGNRMLIDDDNILILLPVIDSLRGGVGRNCYHKKLPATTIIRIF